MGLPLWQPPVESDIPSRPEPKNPAHARSRIRSISARDRGTTAIRDRPAARNGELRSRERRRNLLQDLLARLMEADSNNAPQAQVDAIREEIDRASSEMRAARDRQPRLMTADAPLLPPDLTGDEEPVRHFGDSPGDHRWRTLPRLDHRPDLAHNAERFAQVSERVERARALFERTRRASVRSDLSALEERSRRLGERTQRIRARAAALGQMYGRGGNEASRTESAARVDGLGDRDRSISPENDNAWDTLLTTVTPDPQPPSAGSSFTSMMSAVTRIGFNDSMNRSSATSLTGPDTGGEESALEQPCESDDEGDPVEFEVELGGEADASARHSDAPGSYADVVRRGARIPQALARRLPRPPTGNEGVGGGNNRPDPATDDLILQLVGGLGGMQHIVRNLVSREDIPNDWWVDAGLSRTLPRDDAADNDISNNESANN